MVGAVAELVVPSGLTASGVLQGLLAFAGLELDTAPPTVVTCVRGVERPTAR